MDGTAPPVRTNVAIVLGLMCVFIQMEAALVIVVMVTQGIYVLMVSLSFSNILSFIHLSKCFYDKCYAIISMQYCFLLYRIELQ